MGKIPYNTKFDQMSGPDVSYPANQDLPEGPDIHWQGEMDPAFNHPLNQDKNLLDTGVTSGSYWDQPFGLPTGQDLI